MLNILKNIFGGKERETTPSGTLSAEALFGDRTRFAIPKEDALNIPAVATSVEFVASTIAALPVKLYKKESNEVKEIEDDYRLKLLNTETNDLLDAQQLKKGVIIDYLLDGNGYAYINWKRNKIVSVNYLDDINVQVIMNADPIFKKAKINVLGQEIEEYQLFRLLRNTKNGCTGQGVLSQNNVFFMTMFNSLKYENNGVVYGTKKGFLKSKYRLEESMMEELRKAWRKLCNNDVNAQPSVMVLNEGIDYEAAQSSAIENQLAENKESNSDLVYNIFDIPASLFNVKVTLSEEVYITAIKTAILPIIGAFNTALNKFFLLENEKKDYFFAIDTSEVLKVAILERYQAYDIALKSGWLQVDEVRKKENMNSLELDFVKMNLADVLYYPKTKEIYNANLNSMAKIGEGGSKLNADGKEVEENED